METVKWAEDEDAMIVRLCEADGGAGTAVLHLGSRPRSVDEVDLLERHARNMVLAEDASVPLTLRAREVKTLRVI